jgi:hypothetical protein
MIYNFLAVLEYQSPAVAFVVTLIKTVARFTLKVAILLIVAGVEVSSVDEVAVVGLAPVNEFATAYTPAVTACVGIP